MSTKSVWAAISNETAGERSHFPSLGQELMADVAIVGGGITGVTLALMLAEAGKSVVLLEARAIGCGTTGNSTGNLHETVSAGLRLIDEKWGKELAALVAQARRVAIEHIEWRVNRFGISCAFRRCPLYMFDVEPTRGDELVREYEASRKAGLAAGVMENSPLPYAKGFCLVLENQAQFHPLDYVLALARHAAAAGCRIFEHSPVVAVDEQAKVLETPSGRVRARDIAFATHTPKGLYGVHAQMVPHREYGLAFRSPGDLLPGIYWGQGGYKHSVRTVDTPAGAYMVVVGEDEKTGLHSPQESLERLRAYARSALGVEQCEYAWSAQNYRSPDLLPFIGQTSGSDAYIATGFAADGLTYGTLAALIISDRILGRGSEWDEPFRANRLPLVKAARGVLEETATVAKTFVGDRFDLARSGEFPSLAPGHAKVVNVHGEKLAAYCRPDGSFSVVSAVCTHMKCIVHWNAAEQSWDCPCHGSRFDIEGKVLEGPALTGLEQRTATHRRAA